MCGRKHTQSQTFTLLVRVLMEDLYLYTQQAVFGGNLYSLVSPISLPNPLNIMLIPDTSVFVQFNFGILLFKLWLWLMI